MRISTYAACCVTTYTLEAQLCTCFKFVNKNTFFCTYAPPPARARGAGGSGICRAGRVGWWMVVLACDAGNTQHDTRCPPCVCIEHTRVLGHTIPYAGNNNHSRDIASRSEHAGTRGPPGAEVHGWTTRSRTDAYTTFAHVDRAPTSREQSVAAPRWRVGASRRRTLRPPHTAREGHGTTPQNVPFEVRLRHTNPTRRFGTRTHRRPRSTSAHADMPSRPSGMSGLLSNQKNLMKLSRRTPLKTQKQSHTLTRVFGAS